MSNQHCTDFLDHQDVNSSDFGSISTSSSRSMDNDPRGAGAETDDEKLKAVMDSVKDYVQVEEESTDDVTILTKETRNVQELIRRAREIMDNQEHQFLIQIEISYILHDLENGDYSLFTAASNTELFPNSIKVKTKKDVKKVLSRIENHNWEEFFSLPKSGLVPVSLGYARFIVTKDSMLLTACNCKFKQLPGWLKENRFINSRNDDHADLDSCDSLCVLRAITHFLIETGNESFGRSRSEIRNQLFTLFSSKYRSPSLKPKDFDGIAQEELPLLERLFSIGINMYIFEPVDKASPRYPKQLKGTPIYFSTVENPVNGTCNLLRYLDHVCYITNIDQALGHLVCSICDQKQYGCHYARHFKMCSNKFKDKEANIQFHKYHGAEQYKAPDDVFEEIEKECSKEFPPEMKKIKYLAVFDSEAWFDKFGQVQRRGKTTQSFSRLIPFVVGVCSNVPGFEQSRMFWITELGEGFVEEMVLYFKEMSKKQQQLLKNQLSPMYKEVQTQLMRAKRSKNEYGQKIYTSLLQKLDTFICRLPILTYNGSKFDCRILRRWLLPALFKQYGHAVQTQMKGATYSRICTPDFIILDQLNYLAARTSYDHWIASSLGVHLKSKMPYSWITGLDCLNYPGLPDLPEWYSSLKGYNVLSVDHDKYCQCLQDGLTSDEALKKLGFKCVPKTGEELLGEYRQLFLDSGFTTFKDFVSYYLRFDIEPFVAAAEKQSDIFYKEYNIQLYRSHPSIPSVAVKVGMRYMKDEEIYIASEENYKLLREKTPGGQSIIVQMEAIAGVTKIRESEFGPDSLTCQSIFSLDSGLMYGFTMGSLPTGHEIVRLASNNFIPEHTSIKYSRYKNSERIISYLIWEQELWDPETYLRGGEFKCRTAIQNYRPDCIAYKCGDDGHKQLVVIEIYGHGGHSCPVCVQPPDGLHPIRKRKDGNRMTFAEVDAEDRQRELHIKAEFYLNEIQIVHMCEFRRDYELETGIHHQKYQRFLQDHPQYDIGKEAMSENQLLEQIKDGKLHGFLHADFDCPPELRRSTELFPVLFHKAFVPREATGSIMSQYLKERNLLKKPKLELISSHHGKGLLVATNLVQFYLEMGVRITNVERLIQYDLTDAMFKMVEKASDLRYKASNNEEKVLGNLMKSLVVSCFGKFLLNPKNFTRTKYLDGNGLLKQLYNGNFISLDFVSLDEDGALYELRKRPRTVHHTSPVQLGCWILNSAKLHILSLLYKVIQPCLDPRSWTIFCSQTDSLSFVCSEKNFEDWMSNCVISGMEDYLKQQREKYFVLPGDDEKARKSVYKPGVYKLEWKGEAAFGISAKVYCIFDDAKKIVKLSACSVPYSVAKKLTYNDFFDVLHKHKPITVSFEGFNYVYGSMLSEQMMKCAITPFYIKRAVLPDLSTATLSLSE